MSIRCLAIMLLCALSFGCAHNRDLRFHFVDAATNEPVPEVISKRLIANWQPSIPLAIPIPIYFPQMGDAGQRSDAEGIVEYTNFSTSHKLEFEKQGYARVIVDKTWPWVKMRHMDENKSVLAETIDGSIVVPLRRKEIYMPESGTDDEAENDEAAADALDAALIETP